MSEIEKTKEVVQVEQLLSEVGTIAESYQRISNATGENFNIFSILRIETQEEQTHSRFIAELLNPNGRHQMKDQFLKLFLQEIDAENEDLELEKWFYSEANIMHTAVFKEFNIGKINKDHSSGGKIDILLENGNASILIENKIYAKEQKNQLIRYKAYKPYGKVLFLTRFGEESKYGNPNNYIKISYFQTITRWLDKCLELPDLKDVVKQTLLQYARIIKKLTYQNTNSHMKNEIVSKVLDSKESQAAFKAIYRARHDIRNKFIKDFFFEKRVKSVLSELHNEHGIMLSLRINPNFYILNQEYKSFDFGDSLTEKMGLRIRFELAGASGFKNFVFGFQYLPDTIANLSPVQIQEEFKAVFGVTPKSSIAWPAKLDYKNKNYFNWENWDVLFSLDTDEFEKDFKKKILDLYSVIKHLAETNNQ